MKSDFEYTLSKTRLHITDLDTGRCSVTNDIENVLEYISEQENIFLDDYIISYTDSCDDTTFVSTENNIFKDFLISQ